MVFYWLSIFIAKNSIFVEFIVNFRSWHLKKFCSLEVTLTRLFQVFFCDLLRSIKGTQSFRDNRCSARVTSAATYGLRYLMLTSVPSFIGMSTSAPCKMKFILRIISRIHFTYYTYAEVNEVFRNLCRSSCAEVHLCRSSFIRSFHRKCVLCKFPRSVCCEFFQFLVKL